MNFELKRVGLQGDARVEFIEAESFNEPGHFYASGARGCFASHLKILESAYEKEKNVLVLEDDCDFTRHIFTYELPAHWDVFYGGILQAKDPDNLHESDIVGSHCMGFSSRAIRRLVPWLQDAFAGNDPAPIDGEYVRFRRANPDLCTVFAVPPVAVQRPSRTDIGAQRVFDRLVGLRQAVSLARKVKRKWSRRADWGL